MIEKILNIAIGSVVVAIVVLGAVLLGLCSDSVGLPAVNGTPTGAPHCGDLSCGAGEDCAGCPADCGACPP